MIYKLILDVNKKEIKSNGETIEEAIGGLKYPPVFKTYGTLTVVQGKRRARKIMNVNFLKRFAVNKVLKRIVAKQLSVNFK